MNFLCEKRRTKMKEPETGKKENTGKSGYSITTWRLHLWMQTSGMAADHTGIL